jgi:lysozyme
MINKKKKRVIIIISVFLLLISGVIVYNYGISYYRKYYACPGVLIDSYRFPVVGIDVASHQGKINWQEVYSSKVNFAFIKATEGETFVDKNFATNFKKARENKIIVGAYHFFRFNKNGKEQAYNFINNVKLEESDLPPVLDVELFGGNKYNSETKNKVISEIFNCLRTLEKHYDRKPIIYTNIETYESFIKGNFEDYDLWLCKLCNEPKTIKWKFWQYSHSGVVPGIKSEVDMNIFNGSYEEFVEYLFKDNK